jgi:hypothetical protein
VEVCRPKGNREDPLNKRRPPGMMKTYLAAPLIQIYRGVPLPLLQFLGASIENWRNLSN